MGRGEALYGNRRTGDCNEQAKPTEPAPVGAVPPVPGNPIISESKQQEKRGAFYTARISARPESEISRDGQGQCADKYVDHGNFSVADLVKHPQTVEKEHGSDPEQRHPQQHLSPPSSAAIRRF